MYPTNKFDEDSDRRDYESFIKMVEPTDSKYKLREEWNDDEIEQLIKEGNRLPRAGTDRRIKARLSRLVQAQGLPRSKRRRRRTQTTDN